MSPFWKGFIAFPICTISLILLIVLASREYKAWYRWFKGLPIFQYPAMLLIIIGAKILNNAHCKWMQYENRIWLSPNVRGFDLEEATRRQINSGKQQ